MTSPRRGPARAERGAWAIAVAWAQRAHREVALEQQADLARGIGQPGYQGRRQAVAAPGGAGL